MNLGASERRSGGAHGSAPPADQRLPARRLLGVTLAILLVVIAAAPIVDGITLTSGAASAVRKASALTLTKPGAPPAPAVPAGSGALIAHIRHPTEILAAPGGRPLAPLGTKTNFGSPAFMWVADHVPGWLGVVSPLAGNGRLGWIPQSAAALTRVSLELRVSLSTHSLTVLDNGKVLERYAVAVGKPSSPTPTGRFDVTDRFLTGDPQGAYGCCILALSAVAPHAIADWSGGNRVAIHSTPETASIGNSVTHGCVRVDLADGRWLLNHVPLGTPTLISS